MQANVTYRDGKTTPTIGDKVILHQGDPNGYVAYVKAFGVKPESREIQLHVVGWQGLHFYPASLCAFVEHETTNGDKRPPAPSAPAQPRSLRVIAREIAKLWREGNVSHEATYAAKPYLEAMAQLDNIAQPYYSDTGYSVVAYFVENVRSWRGNDAKRIKAELRAMMAAHLKAKKAG